MRFNHYNTISGMISYADRHNYGSKKSLETDDSMQRYSDIIGEICRGEKCTENFVLQCPRDNFHCVK